MTNFIISLFLIDLAIGCSGRYIVLGNISARMIIFIIANLIFFIKALNTKKIEFNRSVAISYLLLIPFSISIIIGITNNDTSLVLNKAISYSYLIIMFFLIQSIDSKIKIEKFFYLFENAVVICAAVSSLIWVLLYIFKYQTYFYINPILMNAELGSLDIINGSIPRVFLKSSVFFPLMLNISIFKALNDKCKLSKIQVVKLIIMLLGLISTMTIGFWVAFLISSIFIIIFFTKASLKNILISIITLIFIMIIFNKFNIATYLNARISSKDVSVMIKQAQIGMVLDSTENLFFGEGFGSVMNLSIQNISRSGDTIEVMWLELYHTSGIIGVVIYSFFIIYHIIGLFKVYKRNKDVIPISLSFSLISLVIINFSNPFLNNPLGIGFLAFAVSIYCCYEKLYLQKV